jgi:hypothetical protein
MGERRESRTGEKAATVVMKFLNPMMIGALKKYRGVQASAVAKCMISQILSKESGLKIIGSDEI